MDNGSSSSLEVTTPTSKSRAGHPSPLIDDHPFSNEETMRDSIVSQSTATGMGLPSSIPHHYNYFIDDVSVEKPCNLETVLQHIKNVKNLRSFGLLLNIEQGKLDQILKGPPYEILPQIISEWLKIAPTDDSECWKELDKVLREPAVSELKIACDLQRQLRRGSSVDSAISMTPTSSQYDMSFIGKVYIAIYKLV